MFVIMREMAAINYMTSFEALQLAIILILFVPPLLIAIFKYFYDKISSQSSTGAAGFAYDEHQDIFYSERNAWQRKYGYCQLYDEALVPLSMVLDCEPIRFEYGGKKWLIELWKGQYGMLTGAEIGIYYSNKTDLDIPGFFAGTFYEAVTDNDQLYMSLTLKKQGETLFERIDRHWWLTGFVLGEFSEPDDLRILARITMKDGQMLTAFINALLKLGYTDRQFKVEDLSVDLYYSTPLSKQPLTRIPATESIMQKKNKVFCDLFNDLTEDFKNSSDKLTFLKRNHPFVYRRAMKALKFKHMKTGYRKLAKRSKDRSRFDEK